MLVFCIATFSAACNGDEFICKSKRCVEGHNLCDGTDDCGDNEDEDDCDLGE